MQRQHALSQPVACKGDMANGALKVLLLFVANGECIEMLRTHLPRPAVRRSTRCASRPLARRMANAFILARCSLLKLSWYRSSGLAATAASSWNISSRTPATAVGQPSRIWRIKQQHDTTREDIDVRGH